MAHNIFSIITEVISHTCAQCLSVRMHRIYSAR